jgi:hypothetical protein
VVPGRTPTVLRLMTMQASAKHNCSRAECSMQEDSLGIRCLSRSIGRY